MATAKQDAEVSSKIVFDPTMGGWDYRCYDSFPTVAAAENFLKDAYVLHGVVGIVVYTPNDPIMKLEHHGCDVYPFVLLQEGWQEGGSANFIIQLFELVEKHGGSYKYS
jgi:hypothetical protein